MSRQPSAIGRQLAIIAFVLLLAAAYAVAGEVEWKQLHDQAAGHLQQGSLQQAELFARAALREAESLPGPENRAVEQSLSTLSLALRLQGKQEEALPVVQRLVALRTKLHGADDPATGIALHNNAEILIALDRLPEAAKMQARALAIFEKKLGPDHVNTATALHNMGAILLRQGNYKGAESYLRRALAAKEKALKPGHLSIAHTLDNLAAALEGQGRQIEAAKYKKRAESIRQRSAKPASAQAGAS